MRCAGRVGMALDLRDRMFFMRFVGQVCFGGEYSCVTTIAQAIQTQNVGGATLVADGVDIETGYPSNIQVSLTVNFD